MVFPESLEYLKKRLILFKVLGFSSITIVNGKSVTKPIDVLLFVFSLSVGISFCYIAATNHKTLSSSKSKIADYGNFIMLIVSIGISMLSLVLSFIFRHRIWLMLVTLGEVENKV